MSGSRSSATANCRFPISTRSRKPWRSALARLSVAEIARAVNGYLAAGDPGRECSGAAIDSRKVSGGEVFFAFSGAQTDGRRFVGDAFARGAGAAVVNRGGSDRSDGSVRSVGSTSTGAELSTIEVVDAFQPLHD